MKALEDKAPDRNKADECDDGLYVFRELLEAVDLTPRRQCPSTMTTPPVDLGRLTIAGGRTYSCGHGVGEHRRQLGWFCEGLKMAEQS